MISSFIKNNYNYNESFTSIFIVLISITSFIICFYQIIKNNFKSSTDDASITEDDNVSPSISLEEYLSGKHCNGCHNNCLLSSIRCGRGQESKEAVTEIYYETYNVTESSKSYEYNGINYKIDF